MEVDLERLQGTLTRVIGETMQPRVISIWFFDSVSNAQISEHAPEVGR